MIAALCLVSLASLPPSQRALPASPPASLLASVPEDATFAVVIEDFATLWESAQATSWSEVVRDPALDPLWPVLDTALRHKLKDEQLTVQRTLDALAGVVFFARDLGQDDRESVGLVLRLRTDSEAVAAALRAGLERRGESVEHGGRTFTVERGGHSRSFDISFAWSGGVAVLEGRGQENALELAADLARALEGGAPDGGLAARLPLERPVTRAAVEGYLDLGALIASTLNPHNPDGRDAFEALALDDFGWGACHLTIGEGVTFDLRASLELPRTGLAPLLAAHARPVPTTFTHLAPSEAIEVSALGYDVQGAWRSLRAWLADELPDASAEFDLGLKQVSGAAGIDLERELIGQLTGEFASLLLPLPDDGPRPLNGAMFSLLVGLLGSPGSAAAAVHVVGIEDVEAFEELALKLVELSDADEHLEEREVGGRWMQTLEVPDLPLRPTWAFVDGALIVSLYDSPVQAVLERASGERQPGWIDVAGRRQALLAGGAVCGSSVADLRGLTQAKVVGPLVALAGMLEQEHSLGDTGLSPAEVAAMADALPQRVDRFVSGTARTTVSIEGRVLRYRFWGH